jgi:hypothetical protein
MGIAVNLCGDFRSAAREAWLGARSILIFLKGSRSSKRLTHGSNVNFSELNFASFKYLATRVQKIQCKIFPGR